MEGRGPVAMDKRRCLQVALEAGLDLQARIAGEFWSELPAY